MKAKDETDRWNDFVINGLCYNGETNTVYNFDKMCKRFGKEYIGYLQAAYIAKADITDEEFAKLNGGVPQSFIDKKLKPLLI